MKLFQQMLVAPAALGLVAPMAANAADLNIDGVSNYSAASEQVTSASQFSDVHPSDWTYQAISSLAERYGCLKGSTAHGNKAITRFEAASMLNTCLDRVSEMTDDVRRLVDEFGSELAVIQGGVDGLEARVGEFEAASFSTTTKLSGTASFVLGANSFEGDAYEAASANPRHAKLGETDGGLTFSYDYKLALDTSFTGEDLLKTMIRSGNMNNPQGGSGSVGLSGMEIGYDSSNALNVERLYYQFPYGDDVTVTVGPRVRQDDMLAVWPSLYPSDTVLDFFTYAGAPGAYNLAKGGGAGVTYGTGNWDISANYVSSNAENANTSTGGGILNEAANNNFTSQIAYSQDNWGAAFAYTYISSDEGAGLAATNGTPLANTLMDIGVTNSYALSSWWAPSDVGLVPSFSAGWGVNQTEDEDDSNASYDSATTQSWSVGMEWEDAFAEGNILGMAFGQPNFVTSYDNDPDSSSVIETPKDGNYAWEWWYKIQVSDNITVTPAIYYLSRPFGHDTDTRGPDANSRENRLSNLGALVKTTFKF